MHSLCDEITTVFSPAYLRHVGPASLQNRFLFDVGKEKDFDVTTGNAQTTPPIMPRIILGENTVLGLVDKTPNN